METYMNALEFQKSVLKPAGDDCGYQLPGHAYGFQIPFYRSGMEQGIEKSKEEIDEFRLVSQITSTQRDLSKSTTLHNITDVGE